MQEDGQKDAAPISETELWARGGPRGSGEDGEGRIEVANDS